MTESRARLATACGKIILLGEHAVVHGELALAASIGRSADASASWLDTGAHCLHVSGLQGPWPREPASELEQAFLALLATFSLDRPVEVSAHVRIPTRAGLGSSAALGVAIARAVASLLGLAPSLSRDALAAAEWERVFHGNPSGIDVAAAVHGGYLVFSRQHGAQPIPVARPVPLCLAQSGPRAPTRAMVEAATAFLKDDPARAAGILTEVRQAVSCGSSALQVGDLPALGAAMNANQCALRAWRLSTPSIDALCEAAVCAGAAGAKLTGAGGGGSVIALAPGRQAGVLEAWRKLGIEGIVVQAGASG